VRFLAESEVVYEAFEEIMAKAERPECGLPSGP
jgi:hypothetical protein